VTQLLTTTTARIEDHESAEKHLGKICKIRAGRTPLVQRLRAEPGRPVRILSLLVRWDHP
jgi:hypothetical protein